MESWLLPMLAVGLACHLWLRRAAPLQVGSAAYWLARKRSDHVGKTALAGYWTMSTANAVASTGWLILAIAQVNPFQP